MRHGLGYRKGVACQRRSKVKGHSRFRTSDKKRSRSTTKAPEYSSPSERPADPLTRGYFITTLLSISFCSLRRNVEDFSHFCQNSTLSGEQRARCPESSARLCACACGVCECVSACVCAKFVKGYNDIFFERLLIDFGVQCI